MLIKFDKFNKARQPNIMLCNPGEEELFALSNLTDRTLTLRYNSISEFSFSAKDKYSNGSRCAYFDYLETARLVKVEGVATFVITNIVEVDNGSYKSKEVSCKTVEYDIAQKGISIEEGTYKFYDSFKPEKTIMNFIMEMLPDWSIGNIDSDLWEMHRTFEVIDKNVYEFMVSDVEEAFECVFIFDSINRTISAKSIKNAVSETDIFLSHKNVIKSMDITQNAEEIKTALNVYGADDVTIRSVNPLGGTTIYNFDYYKTTEWMPQDLIDSINAWETKIKTADNQHQSSLSAIKKLNGEILNLNTQITQAQGELKSLENIKAVRLEQGLDVTQINEEIRQKQNEISLKQQALKTKEAELSDLKLQNTNTNNALSIEGNFTPNQQKILTRFIKVGKYQNDTFVITDSMSEVDKQNTLEELLGVGKEVLKRVSQPKYSFSTDIKNFLKMVQYKKYIHQLELGCQITLGLNNKHKIAYPVLLEIQIDYDNDTEITLGFGNSLRLDKSEFTLAELIKDTVDVVSDVSFNKGKWGEGLKVKNKFNEYANSSLNASVQDIINSDSQDILIDGAGIRCRRFNKDVGSFDPEMLWITGKSMVFSDDAFETAKTAIGRIVLPDKTTGYGINSEVILGKLIAGGQLIIENEKGSFQVTGDKVTLVNAELIIRNEETGGETTVDGEINRVDNIAKRKISSYHQDEPPEVASHGDLWYDTNEGNKAYRYYVEGLDNENPESFNTWGEIMSKYGVWGSVKTTKAGGVWIPVRDRTLNLVDGVLTADGKVDTNELKGNINAVQNAMMSENNQLVFNGKGIYAMNHTNINQADKVVWMNSAGMLFSNKAPGSDGSREWKTAIDANGITADAITAGTIRAINITGCNLTVTNDKTKTTIDPSVGIKLQKKGSGESWNDVFYVDNYGDAIFKGKLIGNQINVNDKFLVDTAGNVTATSITISGQSTLDAKDMIVRNLVVGGNVTMGADATISWGKVTSKPNVATKDEIPTDLEIKALAEAEAVRKLASQFGITSTEIGESYINSPKITGGVLTGGRIVSKSGGSVTIENGKVTIKNENDSTVGNIFYDANYKMRMNSENGNPIRIDSASDIAISCATGTNRINLEGWVVVKGGKITDENGVSIAGGQSAVFG